MSDAATTKNWMMPELDLVYKIEGGADMTLAQMLDGISSDLIPTDQKMLEDLLWSCGARMSGGRFS